jgi:DNA-binding XRE family transcriptional regulator
MQAVAKTPRIDVRITGEISEKLLRTLEDECGDDLVIITDSDEEFVDAKETDWYREAKAELTPGESLRVYRQNSGLTQEALGKLLGDLPRQHLSNMENGSRAISLGMAKKLAKLLHTSPAHFLDL